MKTCNYFVRHCVLRRATAVAWIALLSCSSGGCAKPVTYVNADRTLTHLKAGEPAPHDGVLMSEGYLSDIYEALKMSPSQSSNPLARPLSSRQ